MIDQSKNQTLQGIKRHLMTKEINNKQRKIGSEIKEIFQNQHLQASTPMYCMQEAFNTWFFTATYVLNVGVLKKPTLSFISMLFF